MSDQDYIRKAIDLADDWGWTGPSSTDRLHPLSQAFCDALAAQLVRQVDALILYRVRIEPTGTFMDHEGTGERMADSYLGIDRTMNTLKCIVDSGVLE